MKISGLKSLSSNNLAQLRDLIAQVSTSATVSTESLRQMVEAPNAQAWIMKDGRKIIGFCVVNLNYKPHYIEGRLDDVVIDGNYRNRGLGRKLVLEALKWVKVHGGASVELTTENQKKVANHLYQSLGFIKRNTNVYKIKF